MSTIAGQERSEKGRVATDELLSDPTYADAILDRLVHNAHRIELTGESLRRTQGKHSKTA